MRRAFETASGVHKWRRARREAQARPAVIVGNVGTAAEAVDYRSVYLPPHFRSADQFKRETARFASQPDASPGRLRHRLAGADRV
jgi:hypothetical protein